MITDYESACVKCHKGDSPEIIPMDFQNTGKQRHLWTTKHAHIPMGPNTTTDEDSDAESKDNEESACIILLIDYHESADLSALEFRQLIIITVPLLEIRSACLLYG